MSSVFTGKRCPVPTGPLRSGRGPQAPPLPGPDCARGCGASAEALPSIQGEGGHLLSRVPAPRPPAGPLPAGRGDWLGPFPGHPGSREGLGGEAAEGPVVRSGRLSCRTARRATWTLSESRWAAKNRGISVGQGALLPVSPATPGSGPRRHPAAGRAGAGGARPHPTSPARSARPALAVVRGIGRESEAGDRVPTRALASGLARRIAMP